MASDEREEVMQASAIEGFDPREWPLVVGAVEAERLALAAEARIQPSRTYDEREHWQILANHYWAQA
jgi:hypothetical protein